LPAILTIRAERKIPVPINASQTDSIADATSRRQDAARPAFDAAAATAWPGLLRSLQGLRAWTPTRLVVALALLLLVISIQVTTGAYRTERGLYSDESAHFLNGRAPGLYGMDDVLGLN